MIQYTINQFYHDVDLIVDKIRGLDLDFIYGVPRGGQLLAGILAERVGLTLVDNPYGFRKDMIIIVDDIVDSGRTREKYKDFPYFISLVRAHQVENVWFSPVITEDDDWIHFWWEPDPATDIQDTIVRQLEYIGEDPKREGLLKTPERIVRSWEELFSGYKQNPEEIFTTFEDHENYNGIVLLKDVELYSCCEHHMQVFSGKAHIAYLPNKRVVGVSKIARLLEIYARRLQIQERIGQQVTSDLMKYLEPQGAACIIEARHLCMMARGVNKQNSIMVTSSLTGAFLDKGLKEEVMMLIKC